MLLASDSKYVILISVLMPFFLVLSVMYVHMSSLQFTIISKVLLVFWKKKINTSGAKLHFLKSLYVNLLKILYFFISTIGAEIPVKNESF